MLSLQRPYDLHCEFGSGLFAVPSELSGRKESGLRYAARTDYRTENYHFAHPILENGLAALQVSLDDIHVESFASQHQHFMQSFCSKHLNNAFRFFWKAIGLVYAFPPFSLLAKLLTKIAYERGRVVLCTLDWGLKRTHLLASTAGPNDCGMSVTPRWSHLRASGFKHRYGGPGVDQFPIHC